MNPISWLIYTALNVYMWIVLIYIIMNLLIHFNIINRYQPFVQQLNAALARLTEPALSRIRKILPPIGGLDLSPLILVIALQFLQRVVVYYF